MASAKRILNNRYQLQDKLGFGGFSEVWRAWDLLEQQEVAVKIFLRQDEEGIRLCRREYESTNAVQHPHIIRLKDFGVEDYMPFLVMPFYTRGSLDHLSGGLEEDILWRVMRDIGSALDYIHNIDPPRLHNDLKPDNILVAENGRFVLTDFGISTALEVKLTRSLELEHPQNDAQGGRTPKAYRAPEYFDYGVLLAQKAVKASDIWSFGASLFELATGELPFGDQGGLYQRMRHADYHSEVGDLVDIGLLRRFSVDLQGMILRCLEAEPWNRPKAMDLVGEANRHIPGAYIPPPPTPPPTVAAPAYGDFHAAREQEVSAPQYARQSLMRTNRQSIRMPAWAWLLTGLLLGIAGFAGYVAMQKNKAEKMDSPLLNSSPMPARNATSSEKLNMMDKEQSNPTISKPNNNANLPPPMQDQSKRINFEPLLKAAKETMTTDRNTVILDELLAHIRAPNNLSEDFICNKVNKLERGAIDIEYVRNYAKEHFGCNLSTIPPQNLGKSGDLAKNQERLPDLPKDCLAGPRKFGVALTSFSTAERAILEVVENKRGLKEYKEVDYIVKDKDIFRCVIQCNSWSKATQKRDELTRAGVKCFAINFCKGDIVKEF